MQPEPSEPTEDGRRRPAAIALLALMALLSLVLWIGVPWASLRLASLLPLDYVSFYLLVLGVVPLMMVGVGLVLYRVNRVYVRVSGEVHRREHTGWLVSQAPDRTSRQPRRAIDVIMACSLMLALLAFTIWFIFAAGSPLPPAG